MIVFASVLLPDPFGPIRAWISPFFTSRLRPLRISLPSTATCRSRMTSSDVWLMSSRSLSARAGALRDAAAAPAGAAGGPRVSGREALPAGTAVAHVRVVELEAGAHQALDVVDLRAPEEHGALEVHEQADAVGVDDLVARRFRFAELHEVGIARTAAATDAEPEPGGRRAATLEQLPDLVRRHGREGDHVFVRSFHAVPAGVSIRPARPVARSPRAARFRPRASRSVPA